MAETQGRTVRMLICDQTRRDQDVPEDSLCSVLLDILAVASVNTDKLLIICFHKSQ